MDDGSTTPAALRGNSQHIKSMAMEILGWVLAKIRKQHELAKSVSSDDMNPDDAAQLLELADSTPILIAKAASIVCDYLNMAAKDGSMTSAMAFSLADAFKQVEGVSSSPGVDTVSRNKAFQKLVLTIPRPTDVDASSVDSPAQIKARGDAAVERSQAVRLSLQLAQRHVLFSNMLSDQIISRFLQQTSDPSVPSRTKALRSLGNIASTDFALLNHPSVFQVMLASAVDPSSSVREVTLDLIGRYVVSGSKDVFNQFYDIISDRILVFLNTKTLIYLQDTGLTVRKRVIKIFRDISGLLDLNVADDYRKMVDLCSKLLWRISQPDEEDSVKVLIDDFDALLAGIRLPDASRDSFQASSDCN
jgi:hypothetical protein